MINFDSTFKAVRFSQIATSDGRDLILKELPAVYAWYRGLRLSEATGSASKFLSRIESILEMKLSDRYRGKLGYLYEVSVQESGGSLGQRNAALLNIIAENAEARNRLAAILELGTFLQAPLYVGKAINLRRRIGDHVSGASGLLDRLESAAISIESCILRYKYINEADVQQIASFSKVRETSNADPMEAIAFLIEELLTRLSPSAFVRRPG